MNYMSKWIKTENKVALKEGITLLECIKETAGEQSLTVVSTKDGINIKGIGWYQKEGDQYRLSHDSGIRARVQQFHDRVQARYKAKATQKILAKHGFIIKPMVADKDRARMVVLGKRL